MAKSKKGEIVEAAVASDVEKPKKERKPRIKSVKFAVEKNATPEEKAKRLYALSMQAKDQNQNPVKVPRARSLLAKTLEGSGHAITANDGVLHAIATIAQSQMTHIIHEAARLTAAIGSHQMITVRDINEAASRCGQNRFYKRHILPPPPSHAKEAVDAN
jgi:hypothetical protein